MAQQPQWNTNTSTLSAVNIGLTNSNDRHGEIRKYFKEEGRKVSEVMEQVHFARKLPFMQVQYGETVSKMSKFVAERPTYTQKLEADAGEPEAPWHHGDASKMRYKEFQESMSSVAHNEHDLNSRRLRYNKEMGRKASVDKIMTGESAMPKEYLFAQGQSHTAILAQTGSLAMPNPNNQPPYIPRGRRWVSDGVGFSNQPPSPRDPEFHRKKEEYTRIKAERENLARSGRPF